MPDFGVHVEEIRDVARAASVILNGSIDAKTVINFQSHLNSVRERGINRFILDMENVRYVNSTGLGYLINLSDSVQAEDGDITLVKVQPKVKVVFDMLGLNQFFKIYNTYEEALQRYSEEPASASEAQGNVAGLPKSTEPTVALAPLAPSVPHLVPKTTTLPVPRRMDEPQHIGCQTCRTTLAVKEPGTYKCPRCLTLLDYQGGGKVTFLRPSDVPPVFLSLTFSPECVRGLLEFVGLFAQKAGFTGAGVIDLKETVNRTVEDIRTLAYGGSSDKIYQVLVASVDSEVELRFADYGTTIQDNGHSFLVTRERVDRFELKHHPKGGNVLTIAKKAV